VADEMVLIMERYKPDRVWYADDVFTMDRAWLKGYARELERRGITTPFEATSREDRLDEDVIRTLAEMGCFRLWIGAESGSQRILDRMERRIDARRVPEMVRLLQGHGIEAGLFVMLGYEGEEMPDLQATAQMLEEAQPDRLLTVTAYPIKGTPYYARVEDRIVEPVPWEEGSDRDLMVAQRHSERFYRFATRWLVNSVRWRQHRQQDRHLAYEGMKARVNIGIGRLGMWLTHRETVRGA
jgi:radical SAM superfamily enzyme YgiQ (UPF0313 family)